MSATPGHELRERVSAGGTGWHGSCSCGRWQLSGPRLDVGDAWVGHVKQANVAAALAELAVREHAAEQHAAELRRAELLAAVSGGVAA